MSRFVSSLFFVLATTVTLIMQCSVTVLAQSGEAQQQPCSVGSVAYDVRPAPRKLSYVGPNQRIMRDGTMNVRCFQGQHYEDLFMFHHYLHNLTGGVFVEIGALDGYSYSVSYFFEKYLDWSGLLIEASPLNYQLYLAKMRRLRSSRRRSAPFVVNAVCDEPRNLTFVAKSGTGAGILEFMPAPVRERNLHECAKGSCQLLNITCVRLADLLSQHHIDHVDLFILDVEGAEREVLQTLDFSRTPVHFFVVEMDGKSEGKDSAVRCILRKNGYTPIGRLALNEIWESQNFDENRYIYSESRPNPRRWKPCFISEIEFPKSDNTEDTLPDRQRSKDPSSGTREDQPTPPAGGIEGGSALSYTTEALALLTVAITAYAAYKHWRRRPGRS